jgi:hypothetical protein
MKLRKENDKGLACSECGSRASSYDGKEVCCSHVTHALFSNLRSSLTRVSDVL